MKQAIEKMIFGAACLMASAIVAAAQVPQYPPPPVTPSTRVTAPSPRPRPTPPKPPSATTELSLKVDSAINLEFACITEGKIRINGWNRNEVRVFVADGKGLSFRTAESSPKSGDPVWVKVTAARPERYGPQSDCISGSDIEVDAPVTSTIRVRGRDVSTFVDSVKKVDISTIGGDISLRRIASGVVASSGRGDVTVEASEGPMRLNTTTGNILVFEASPSEVGEVFKANTHSGSISLQSVNYRQLNVDSISGSLMYGGKIMPGGTYDMRTSKGSIRLFVPQDAAFQIQSTYGYGSFITDIPVDVTTETIAGGGQPVKKMFGTVGKAGKENAIVKLTTANGSISLKRLDH